MRQPSGKTKYIALLAHPVSHVKAPSFINPEFERIGLDWFLMPLHVRPENLEDAVYGLQKIDNLLGVNLTIPHKEEMAKLCSDLGPNAKRTKTVNAVRFDNGKLIGEMFDGVGLIIGQKQNGIDVAGRSALILGAGGAGRAIAFSYLDEGVTRLGIYNRSMERAEKLVADIKKGLPDANVEVSSNDPTSFDLICNCTSLGLHEGDAVPVEIDKLTANKVVVDIIAVRETELMIAAIDKGCKVIGGVPMAVGQVSAFAKFFLAKQNKSKSNARE